MSTGWSVQGVYFAAQSSREQAVTLKLEARAHGEGMGAPRLVARTDTGRELDSAPLDGVQIEAPLVGLPRRIVWPSGGHTVTEDAAGVRELEQLRAGALRAQGKKLDAGEALGRVDRAVTWLEGHWPTALLSVVLVAAFSVWAVRDGLPMLAGAVAERTPAGVLRGFDDDTLELLENEYLYPTELDEERQAEVQALFTSAAQSIGGPDTPYKYNLLLRGGGMMGANAFALPGGTVVMTDELVTQAYQDLPPELARQGIAGVLAHEIGHVEERHSLQGIYQAMGLGFLAAAVTGDVVSGSSVAVAAPTFFIRQGYSRRAEYEADEYGGNYVLAQYGSTEGLRELLVRLEGWALDEDEALEGQDAGEAAEGTGNGWEELLYTHPDTAKRVERLRELETIQPEL